MHVLVGYFSPQFFGIAGLSTDFLVEHKLGIVKTKLPLKNICNLSFK